MSLDTAEQLQMNYSINTINRSIWVTLQTQISPKGSFLFVILLLTDSLLSLNLNKKNIYIICDQIWIQVKPTVCALS